MPGVDPASIPDALLRSLAPEVEPAAERDAMARLGATLLLRGEPGYPLLLASIPDPPRALWVRGSLLPQDEVAIAIVGSRRASAYGVAQAGRIACALVAAGHPIVSGAAVGIDAEAHRATLRAGGRTIAVLGGGLARPHPPRHHGLLDAIVEAGGAVVSEFPMGFEARAWSFPRRNRIVSGLSLGVVVVEAARPSGALITARLAVEEHHREVMAVPGPVDQPTSRGCHHLIRSGGASLVECGEDVLAALADAGVLVAGARERAGMRTLSPEAEAVRRARLDEPGLTGVDDLCAATGLSPARVQVALTMLRLCDA